MQIYSPSCVSCCTLNLFTLLFTVFVAIGNEAQVMYSEQQSSSTNVTSDDSSLFPSPLSSSFLSPLRPQTAAPCLFRLSLGWLIDTDYNWRHISHNLWGTRIKAVSSHNSGRNAPHHTERDIIFRLSKVDRLVKCPDCHFLNSIKPLMFKYFRHHLVIVFCL